MKKTLNKPRKGKADAGFEVGSGLHRQLRDLYSLAELNLLIAQGMEGEELGWLVVTAIPSLLEVPFAAMALEEAEDGNWQVIGQHDKRPLDATTAQEVTSLMADGLANRALSLIGCLLLADLPEASGTVPESLTKLGLKSALVVAVRTTRNKFGVLMVGSEVTENYDSTQRFLIGTLANQVAVALENASLVNQAKESEERYMQLFEGISDAVMVYGSHGRFLDCNEATLQRLGCSREEFLRLESADIVHPDFQLLMKDNHERIWAGETTVVESAHRCKDGRVIPVEAHACRIEYGGQPAILAVVRDITERKRAEEALRQSEQKLRLMFESIGDGIVVTDLEGTIVEANEAALRMAGDGHREELIGQSIFEFVLPKDGDMVMRIMNKVLKEGQGRKGIEYTVLDANGRELEVEISSALLRDSSGNPAGVIAVVRDITERKKAEEELIRLSSAVRIATDSIVVSDLEGAIIEVNEATLKMYGTDDKADLVGKNSLDIIAPEDREKALAGIKEVLEKGYYENVEYHIITKDGSKVLVEMSSAIMKGVDGKPTGFVAVSRDITKRKRTEEALRESEAKLRLMFDSVVDGIIVSDLEGNIIEANRVAVRTLGYRRKEEFVGRNAFDFVVERDRARVMEDTIKRLDQRRFRGLMEYTLLAADGREFEVEFSAAALRDSSGNPSGLIGVVRDITERKRAEEELIRLSNAVRMSTDSIVVSDLEANIIEVNEATLKMYGTNDKGDLIGKSTLDIIAPEDREKALAGVKEVLEKGYYENVEYHIISKDGSKVLVEMSSAIMKGVDGKPTGFVAVSRDITERKQAEVEISRHAKRVEALYAVAQAVSWPIDMDELLNQALAKVLEAMDADVGGIYLADSQAVTLILKAHSGVSEEFVGSIGLIQLEEAEIKRGLEQREPVIELDKVFTEANLAKIAAAIENEEVRAHIIVPFWSRGVPLGALVIADRRERQFSAEDIDLLRAIGNEIAVGIENARLLERTRELSVTDELTGLYNRRHFYEILDTEIHRTQRYNRSFSLVILDIDMFKQYNNRYGHTNGDGALQSLARTVTSALRKSDMAFRFGGDEFTIILPATDSDRAKKIVDRIESKWLQMPKAQYPTLESPLGFSAGIAQFPEHAETADGLVFLADTALYYAKKEGGYRAVMVSDLGTLSPDVLSMATMDQVYALAATVDAKDPYTYGHSTRVAVIAETIGKAIGLSEKGLADLYVASLLHDIGKIGVPDSILTKPGKLIEDEWGIVKKHSAEGARIFGYVKELRALTPMILHHHEWYDGMGYPNGLKGEEIPLGARIISIADAYDTMTTPRPYRDVIAHEEALEELTRCSGTQFDPELVEAFCRATTKAET